MSFTLRNLSVSPVEIDDLGIYIDVGEDYDLTIESAVDVAASDDLTVAISAGDLIIIDPLDTGSPLTLLSIADSLTCVSLANDSHFRIQGGELAQLDDVSNTTPTDNYVLTYNAGNSEWEPKAASVGAAPEGVYCFPFYLANGLQDNITVASGLFPFYRADGSQDNIVVGICPT